MHFGRFSLPPSLEPDYAADQIVKAVLKNQEILIIPKSLNFIIPFMMW